MVRAPRAARDRVAPAVDSPRPTTASETCSGACLSSILVKVSWRRSDTSAKKVRHHRPAGTTAILFHKKVRELGRRIAELRGLVPDEAPKTTFFYQDVRRLTLPEPVDVVVTSPPYPSTYDYLPLQQLRLVWMGLHDEGREIGGAPALAVGRTRGEAALARRHPGMDAQRRGAASAGRPSRRRDR